MSMRFGWQYVLALANLLTRPHGMRDYFIRRFLLIFPTMLGISFVVFLVTRMAPGGPIEQAMMQMQQVCEESGGGQTATGLLDAEQRKDLERYYGLDKPIRISYLIWLGTLPREKSHRDVEFAPEPVQSPRIPVWVGAKWRNKRPLRRSARWDGVFPIPHGVETITPEDLRTVVDYVREHRDSAENFDVVLADHDGSRSPESLAAYEARALILGGPPAL